MAQNNYAYQSLVHKNENYLSRKNQITSQESYMTALSF